jgi:hypothetical protein
VEVRIRIVAASHNDWKPTAPTPVAHGASDCVDEGSDSADEASARGGAASDGVDEMSDYVDNASASGDEVSGGVHEAPDGVGEASDGIDEASDGVDEASEGVDELCAGGLPADARYAASLAGASLLGRVWLSSAVLHPDRLRDATGLILGRR